MIVVTGGAGFIGSNLVRALCDVGEREVVVVDRFDDTRKLDNLLDLPIADAIDSSAFLAMLEKGDRRIIPAKAVVHLGARTNALEPTAEALLTQNWEFSRALIEAYAARNVPVITASSASVYGMSRRCVEDATWERPMSAFGWSKLMVDRHIRRRLSTGARSLIALRLFSVYGRGEAHKGRTASLVHQFGDQLQKRREALLFGGTPGVGPGQHRRDFVHVDDVVAVIRWFLARPHVAGIYNVGTGRARTIEECANACMAVRGGKIGYTAFPAELLARYPATLEADLNVLRAVGCDVAFRTLEQGVRATLTHV